MARKTIRRKKKESLINFASSLNRKSNIRYVWDMMKTVKNSFNTIDWRRWQNKDRETMILEEIDKIAPLGGKEERSRGRRG